MLVGFSGGLDSSVLLFLAYAHAKRCGAPLYVLHLHHGIRGEEADRDAAFSRAVAEAYGLPFLLRKANVPRIAAETGESLEAAARRVRYEAFSEAMEEHNIPLLLTAHHANDNLETMLFHLLRGSGLRGLCGIPPARKIGSRHLVRPLLEIPRDELLAFAERNAIPYVEDSSNADNAYTRNLVRMEIVPQLSKITPHPEASALRTANSLSRDRDFLDGLAADLLSHAADGDALSLDVLRAAPDAVLVRALLLYWQMRVPRLSSYESTHLEALLTFTRQGETGTHLSLKGGSASLLRGLLKIDPQSEASAPKTFSLPLTEGESHLPGRSIIVMLTPCAEAQKIDICGKNIYNSATQIPLCFDTILRGLSAVTIRTRLPGDRILLRGVHRSLRSVCNEYGLSTEERAQLLVVARNDEVLWIPAVALSDTVFSEAERATHLISLSKLPFEAAKRPNAKKANT